MTAEVPLQIDLLTGELVDTRTRKQKRVAREANGYWQGELFSQREIAQFGVQARPTMPAVGRNGKPLGMALMMEDLRTEEEKALGQQKAAEEMTEPLFPNVEPARDGTHQPLRLPEEMANTAHSLFGPDLHFYRSLFFMALAMDGEL